MTGFATHTLALIIQADLAEPALLEILSNESEILFFETQLKNGNENPLTGLYERREKERESENEFANYVEELLSQPFLKASIKEQGVQWFMSKIKIENFEKSEQEAADTVAQYALKLFSKNQKQVDFYLSTGQNQIHIRIFSLREGSLKTSPAC